MFIRSLNIENCNNGLEDIRMNRLSEIVLIAGKNGSGKTRLINTIKSRMDKIPTLDVVNRISSYGKLKDIEAQIAMKEAIVTSFDYDEIMELKNLRSKVNEIYSLSNYNEICVDNFLNDYDYIDFIPTRIELTSPNSLSYDKFSKVYKKMTSFEPSSFNEGSLYLINSIQNRYYDVMNPLNRTSNEMKEEVKEKYTKIKYFLEKFLGTEYSRCDETGNALLFNQDINKLVLSAGQSILVQISVKMYLLSQALSNNNALIFIDEPENHLHPEISIDFINELRLMVPSRQLWILTHSLNIVSEYANESLWYFENGRISFAGRISEKVVKELVGEDERLTKFKEFVSLPEKFRAVKFISECLLEPSVVSTDKNDPQIKQIKELVDKYRKENEKLKLLDFGIGRGRLISNLIDLNIDEGRNTKDYLDYYAYDIDNKFKELCEDIIYSEYTRDTNRYVNDLSEYAGKKNFFDVILLTNVLHEISPTYWTDLFGEKSQLLSLLKEDGLIIIVEDQFLSVGELAYSEGFLICDSEELKILFNLDSYDCFDANGDGRLKAHCISKKNIEPVNNVKIAKLLKNIIERSLNEIVNIRYTRDIKNGRLHAFYSQQYINANLILKNHFQISDNN